MPIALNLSSPMMYFLVPFVIAFLTLETPVERPNASYCNSVGFVALNSPDQLTYEVIRNNKIIGIVRSSRFHKGVYTEYVTESTVQVNILIDFTIYSRVNGIYASGQLVSGSVVRKINNNTRVNAKIAWLEDKYSIEEDGKKVMYHGKIPYASSCLMFVEPVGLSQIFSEASKIMIPIKQVKPHHFELHLPDGNKNYYTYEDGICVSAEVNTSLSKASFRLKK